MHGFYHSWAVPASILRPGIAGTSALKFCLDSNLHCCKIAESLVDCGSVLGSWLVGGVLFALRRLRFQGGVAEGRCGWLGG